MSSGLYRRLFHSEHVSGERVDEVDDGIDDHQRPHSETGLHGLLAVVHLVVNLDGETAASGVHDCGREAEERFKKVVLMVEEDVSRQEGDGGEERGPNSDHTGQLPVTISRGEDGGLGELEVVVAEEPDTGEGDGDLQNFEEALGLEESLEVEGETHDDGLVELRGSDT